MLWCRVTRYPRVFRGLTGCQRDSRDRGVTEKKDKRKKRKEKEKKERGRRSGVSSLVH